MRTWQNCLFRVCNSQGVSHHYLCLPETQSQLEEWENLRVDKREAFKLPWLQLVGAGKVEETDLLEVRQPMWFVRRTYLAFSGWSQVGSIATEVVIWLPGLAAAKMRVSMIFLYIAWPWLICIFRSLEQMKYERTVQSRMVPSEPSLSMSSPFSSPTQLLFFFESWSISLSLKQI